MAPAAGSVATCSGPTSARACCSACMAWARGATTCSTSIRRPRTTRPTRATLIGGTSRFGSTEPSRPPGHVGVQRVDRPRHVSVGHAREDWRREARGVNLDDAILGKEDIESGAEVAARLHVHRARGGDVDAEALEHRDYLALLAYAHHDHADSAHLDERHEAQFDRVTRGDAALSDQGFLVQCHDLRVGFELAGERMRLVAVEAR